MDVYITYIFIPVARFKWDARLAEGAGRDGPGLRLSACGRRASVAGFEPRVALADTPLARGRHYWTLTLDEFPADADPAFGVARADVALAGTLGTDARGWAMYVDERRSWFAHGGAHAGRVAGGVGRGAVVGVLLDLERGELRFTVEGEARGGVAFRGLRGVFYPAVSLHRGVAVTLRAGLDPPDLLDPPV